MLTVIISLLGGIIPFAVLASLNHFGFAHPWLIYFSLLFIFGITVGYYYGKVVAVGWLLSSIIVVVFYHLSTNSDPQKAIGYVVYPIMEVVYLIGGIVGIGVKWIKERMD